MIAQYIKTGLRNLKRYSTLSAINVAGLSIGLASAMLILLWVYDEWSYDRHFSHADNLFRVTEKQNNPGGTIEQMAIVPSPSAQNLKNEYPEIIRASRFILSPLTLKKGDEFVEEIVASVDRDFLKMFDVRFIEGDVNSALNDPHSIVFTEEMAAKYFGNEDPLGKTLQSRGYEVKITGVVKKLPYNSHIHFNFLAPVEWLIEFSPADNEWQARDLTYIELKGGTDWKTLDEKVRDFIKKHKEGSDSEMHLQKIKDIHLFSSQKYMYDSSERGDIVYVRILTLIAILILVIACINFMNLSTAQSTDREREIAIRKISGANSQKIVLQFFVESLLTVTVALGIAIILTELLLPAFNQFTAKNLQITHLGTRFSLGLIILILFCVLLAGTYPAFYLLSLKPNNTIRGLLIKNKGNTNFRKTMVVFQFSISLLLIIFTLVVRKQISYFEKKDLGFDRSNIGYFMFPTRPGSAVVQTLKNELKKNPDILNVTIAHPDPFNNESKSGGYNWSGKKAGEDILFHTIGADADYAATFGLKVTKGRFFSSDFTSDATAAVINETAAKIIGFKDPLGSLIITNRGIKLNIIGIVRDFNFQSLHYKIEPLIMRLGDDNNLIVKMKPEKISSCVDYITKTFNSFDPGLPIDFHFLDDDFEDLYRTEKRSGKITGLFSMLAILISCMGLLALSSYMLEKKTKEVGIRKVNGAHSFEIFSLLSMEYLTLVIISFVLIIPFAWFVSYKWLQNFAYHTDIGIRVFLLAFLITMVLTFVLVGVQSFRAAVRNPVEALRYE